jgi:hypothetical protein
MRAVREAIVAALPEEMRPEGQGTGNREQGTEKDVI